MLLYAGLTVLDNPMQFALSEGKLRREESDRQQCVAEGSPAITAPVFRLPPIHILVPAKHRLNCHLLHGSSSPFCKRLLNAGLSALDQNSMPCQARMTQIAKEHK